MDNDMKNIVAWFFGAVSILNALFVVIEAQYLAALLYLGAAFIALPPAMPYRKQYGLEIGPEAKAIIWIVLSAIAAYFAGILVTAV